MRRQGTRMKQRFCKIVVTVIIIRAKQKRTNSKKQKQQRVVCLFVFVFSFSRRLMLFVCLFFRFLLDSEKQLWRLVKKRHGGQVVLESYTIINADPSCFKAKVQLLEISNIACE